MAVSLRKIGYFLAVLFCSAMLFSSCDSDDIVFDDHPYLRLAFIDEQGNEYEYPRFTSPIPYYAVYTSIVIITDSDWWVEIDEDSKDWISFRDDSPSSGTGSTEFYFNISGNQDDQRTGKLRFHYGEGYVNFSFTQDANPDYTNILFWEGFGSAWFDDEIENDDRLIPATEYDDWIPRMKYSSADIRYTVNGIYIANSPVWTANLQAHSAGNSMLIEEGGEFVVNSVPLGNIKKVSVTLGIYNIWADEENDEPLETERPMLRVGISTDGINFTEVVMNISNSTSWRRVWSDGVVELDEDVSVFYLRLYDPYPGYRIQVDDLIVIEGGGTDIKERENWKNEE